MKRIIALLMFFSKGAFIWHHGHDEDNRVVPYSHLLRLED